LYVLLTPPVWMAALARRWRPAPAACQPTRRRDKFRFRGRPGSNASKPAAAAPGRWRGPPRPARRMRTPAAAEGLVRAGAIENHAVAAELARVDIFRARAPAPRPTVDAGMRCARISCMVSPRTSISTAAARPIAAQSAVPPTETRGTSSGLYCAAPGGKAPQHGTDDQDGRARARCRPASGVERVDEGEERLLERRADQDDHDRPERRAGGGGGRGISASACRARRPPVARRATSPRAGRRPMMMNAAPSTTKAVRAACDAGIRREREAAQAAQHCAAETAAGSEPDGVGRSRCPRPRR